MKKGVFFSLAVFLASLVLISLVLIIFNATLETKERAREAGIFDRISDFDQSIQNSLKEIFNLDSGIKIIIKDNQIIFNENLTNINKDNFINTNTGFKTYVETQNTNNPRITVNTTKFTEKLPLTIKSHNVVYSHPNGYGNDIIEIAPEQVNIKGYNITINVFSSNAQNINWIKSNECGSVNDKDCIHFDIYVYGDIGQPEKSSKILNGLLKSELDINLNTGNIKININEPAKVSIDTNNPDTININTLINLTESEEQIAVYYPENTIEISLIELLRKKQSTARIA